MKEKIQSIESIRSYNICICLLALISVILALSDFYTEIPYTLQVVDTIIYCIFVADFLLRLFYADQKRTFLRLNVWDLIAILPFNSAMRVFRMFKAVRLMKLSKLAKLAKIGRIGTLSARMAKKCARFLNTNGFKYMLFLSMIILILATFAIMLFEDMNFSDALWWAFVTTTTVGYGDLSPVSWGGRIIAGLLMIVGIGLISSLTSSITGFFMNSSTGSEEVQSEKVKMVLVLYEQLNEAEQELFRKNIEKIE